MIGVDDQRRLGFPDLRAAGLVSIFYAIAFGAALFVMLRGDAFDALLCFGSGAIAAVLAATSQGDRKQYIARLVAAVLFLPIGLLMWASSHPAGDWRLVVLAVGHGAGFVLLLLWLARFCTRMLPAIERADTMRPWSSTFDIRVKFALTSAQAD